MQTLTERKVDYNIEFAHIYVDEVPTDEHFTSAAIARETVTALKASSKSYTIGILIDDYNPSESILNIGVFVKHLNCIGIDPDYIVMESALVDYKDMALAKMNGKPKRRVGKYIDENDRCPCSFLVAIWHMIRLGVLSDDGIILESRSNKPFQADRVITILPERYRSTEEKALAMIRTADENDLLGRIEHRYF